MSDEADLAFVRYKSQSVISWSLLNLRRLHERPSALSMGKPLAGRTAFVVGAGRSLEQNGHELVEAQKRNAPIICVNASDPILRDLGVRPDVCVVRESLDHSDTVAASEAPLIACDIGVHPDTWEAAGKRLAWYLPGYPHYLRISHALGIQPSYGGSAALTTAVGLAMSWGASRIVLVGVDLCFAAAADGEWWCYHPKAPRGSCKAHVVGDRLHLSGNDDDDARALRSGQRPQPREVAPVWMTPLDWSAPRPSNHPMADQREWLETQASRHARNVELVNATASGAGIAGWRRGAHGFSIDSSPIVFPAVYPVTAEINRKLIAELDTGAERLSRLCDEMLAPRGPRLTRVAELCGPASLTEALAAHRIVDAPTGDPLATCVHTYEGLRWAAYETRRLLAEGP